MRRRLPDFARASVALVAVVAVSACAAIELATREPPRLFQLTPKSTFEESLPATDATLAVEVPSATAGLNTGRIALRPTPTTLEYYAGASWIDVVPIMVQNLLIESLDNTGRVDVLGREVVGVRADYALLTHVREFQAEYEGDGPPDVRVRLQVRLVRLPRRISVAATSEEAVVPAESTSLADIVTAFDRAFGDVTKDVVGWTVEQLAAAESAPS